MNLKTIAADGQKLVELLERAQAATKIGGAPAATVLAMLDHALGAAIGGTSDDVTAAIAKLESALEADIDANDKTVDAELDAKFPPASAK